MPVFYPKNRPSRFQSKQDKSPQHSSLTIFKHISFHLHPLSILSLPRKHQTLDKDFSLLSTTEMTDFEVADLKPYQQPLWRAPPPSSETLWRAPSNRYQGIPEPLYRLRVSILYNGHAHFNHPSRVFVRSYPSVSFLNPVESLMMPSPP